MPKINQAIVLRIPIPLPSPEEQLRIVAEIEEERQLVGFNKRLIELFQAKINKKIASVWGE